MQKAAKPGGDRLATAAPWLYSVHRWQRRARRRARPARSQTMEAQGNGVLSGWRGWGESLPWPLRGLARVALGRRRALWLAVTIVVVPLLLMLGLQYLWLVDLERKSAITHYASL